MASVKVGVRELKTRLSAYVRAVEAGATVIITERGKPVGRITAIQQSVDLKIHDLAKSGLFRWNGKKFAPAGPPIRSRMRKKIADIIVENRG
ncbi:MAG: type II toxin-antitoxin system prevent-host-death family antitoxin [Acidobacteriota bacterium]|jgi:prevent-host-death family protein